MKCLECHELIQCCLDGEPAASRRDDLARHLMMCPDCRDLYAAAQCLLDGLRLFAPPQPPAGLLEEICQRIARERVRAARLRRGRIASAVAATFLLACGAVYLAAQALSTMPIPPGLTQVPQVPASSLSFNRHLEEAGKAVVALTRQTADETMDQTKLLLPVSIPQTSIGGAYELEQVLAPPARSLREFREGMSAGLEPMASSARRAVGLFLRGIRPVENSLQ